jgi:predicted nucleic acid-binding protein
VALVADISIVLSRVLREATPRIVTILARLGREEWIVPALWWFELRNVLVVNERRGRLSEQETLNFLRELSSEMTITIEPVPDETAVMALARRHRLTVYDAAYLELALRERLPLATLDASLAAAAREEGVAVLADSDSET